MPSTSFTLTTNTPSFLKSNQESRKAFFEKVSLNLTRAELLFLGRFKAKRMNKPREWASSMEYARSQSGTLGRDWFVGPGPNQTISQNNFVTFTMFSTTPYAPYMLPRIHFFEEVSLDFIPHAKSAIDRAAVLLR